MNFLSVDHYQKKTKRALLLTNILNEPLFALYNIIAFILCKDLGASALQIAVLTMLRPTVSLLSLYWSINLQEKSHKLKSNLLGAGFLSRVLFLFFPFYQNIWFIIVAAAVYLMFYRAGIPAWMEILKLNLPEKKREKVFAWGSAIGFLEGSLLALFFGRILDTKQGSWELLFFFGAVLGMVNLLWLAKVPINHKIEPVIEKKKEPLSKKILKPWKESFHLMKTLKDFAKFQWGFMISGVGIMIIQPVIPLFFKDSLHLSYMEIIIALSIYKSLGFFISSPIWGRLLNRFWINYLSSFVFIFVGCFPFFLIFASYSLNWVYFAYFLYGVAQGGSHLVWNLSGPIFSENEHSAKYSRVNIVMVGIRGALIPPLGGILCMGLGPIAVLVLGGSISLYSGYWMLRQKIRGTISKKIFG